MRSLRKHQGALIALAVYHFVFFFPTIFMQRMPSPNDVFYNYAPWIESRSIDVQNSVLNDPPTSYFTLMSLLKNDWSAFHWNPFIACGIPGFGSSASAVLSPFILLPVLALPLAWVYSGIILLKLNVAFFFTYLWLREEGMGKRAAAIGAIVVAACGPFAVRWWWQATNAAALYPALLWIVRRTMRGKRVPFWLVSLIALAYALAGFPAAMLYGAYLSLAYVIVLGLQRRADSQSARRRLRAGATSIIVAALLAIAIAAPSIVPLAQFLRRSGYLEIRANSATQAFPFRHLLLFLFPDRLGNLGYHLNWTGDPTLGESNNYIEATIYAGLLPLLLAGIALINRRARLRWFWLGALIVTLACMFGVRPISTAIAHLPLLQYSALRRFQLLLPLPIGYLAAAASAMLTRRRAFLAAVITVLISTDLALFAGRFYPFIPPELALPPITPTIAFLQQQPKPFRIAAFFNYMWPNTSELFHIEDIRSHFSSEAEYRRLLQRIDPTSSANQQTVIELNSLKFNFFDPLVSMLGIRYYIEHKQIDILKWTIFGATKPGVRTTGAMVARPGTVLQRHLKLDEKPFYAIELPVKIRKISSANPRLIVSIGHYRRAFTPADIGVMNKIYVPLQGDILRVEPAGMTVELLQGAVDTTGDAPLFYGRVTVPLMFDRELPDGRLFVNPAEIPRFHAVTRLSKMSHEEFLTRTTNADFAREAVITGSDFVLADTADAEVTLRRYAEGEQRVEVHAPAGTFLASSEKLTPELRVTIDGREVVPVEINLLFAGVRVPAGDHQVVFSRRIGRGWWWISVLALGIAVALSIIDVVRSR